MMKKIHNDLILINRKLYLAIGFLLGFGLAAILVIIIILCNDMVLPF